MNVALWVAQGVLALIYLAAGAGKLTQPKQKLLENPNMAWTEDFSPSTIKLIGGLEVLGALGLVLPWATGIAPVLTPIAAVGLALVQIGAIVVHGRRRETKVLPINLLLLMIAVVIAIGRF